MASRAGSFFKHAAEEFIQVRELLQARLVAAIFSRSKRHEFILKGGLALRLAYQSQRYTKDVDLDQGQDIPIPRSQKVMREAIRQALASGLLKDRTISEPKQTDTVLRWKIGGDTEHGSHVSLTVEISRREPAMNHVSTVQYLPPAESGMSAVFIETYDLPALAAGKLAALLSPNRAAPRDLFDLELLLAKKVVPAGDLMARLMAHWGEDREKIVAEIWRKIDLLDYELFRQEVFPALPESAQVRITKSHYEDLRLRVGNGLEHWIIKRPNHEMDHGA